MNIGRLQPQVVALYVSLLHICVCWRSGGRTGYAIVPAEVGTEPEMILGQALEEVKKAGLMSAHRLSWRIVLTGGYYGNGPRPRGRWSRELAQAAAADLESVCPVSFDDLQTTSIPMGANAAWCCGFPRVALKAWRDAAAKKGLKLEGVWSMAGALVDFLLEQSKLEQPELEQPVL